MELEQLIYFTRVAHLEHVSKAANELNISQPALSLNIRKLETELGVKLFDRYGKNIRINQYGKVFLANIEPIIADIERTKELLSEMKRAKDNKIRIAAPPMFSFPDLLESIYAACPNSTVINIDAPFNELVNSLTTGQLDFCILGTPMSDPKLDCYTLTRDEMIMLLPPAHKLADRETAELTEFSNDDFAYFQKVGDADNDLENLCSIAGFTPHIVYQCRTLFDLVTIVKRGGFVALVPLRTLANYDTTGLSRLRISEPECYTHLRMYWAKAAKESHAVKAARKCVIDYFEKNP